MRGRIWHKSVALPAFRVILLPGIVLPAESAYEALIAALGPGVEAVAKGAAEQLRPGMEGIGKIQVDRRKLGWIWTHKLVHWWRMWVWSWWP